MIDNPCPGGHCHQQERAQKLDDQPDPQGPLLERVHFELKQVSPAYGSGVLGVLIVNGTSHRRTPLSRSAGHAECDRDQRPP
jgi:hypothetical protein